MQILRIKRPLLSHTVSQGFGENRACINRAGRVVSKGRTCPTGYEDFYKSIGMFGHNGIDYPCFVGEAIIHGASFDGWLKTEVDSAGGIGVDVVSNEPQWFRKDQVPSQVWANATKGNDGGAVYALVYVKTRSWHLKTAIGWDHRQVLPGQMVGLGGNTGASSAAHLHYGAKWCDEFGRTLYPGNGYNGAFDITPFIDNSEYAAAGGVPVGAAVELTDTDRRQVQEQLSVMRRVFLHIREVLVN